MIRNRKTVKGKLGKTRPKDTDFKAIANKNKKKKTEQKKSQTKKVSLGRQISKKKQQMGMGKGKKGLGMLNVMTGQQANQPSKKKTKRVIDTQKRGIPTKVRKALEPGGISNPYMHSGFKAGGKTSKYRMAGGGKTSKYRMAGGGKTSKYRMKGGGKTSKYMAKGGKTSKYMARGGRAK